MAVLALVTNGEPAGTLKLEDLGFRLLSTLVSMGDSHANKRSGPPFGTSSLSIIDTCQVKLSSCTLLKLCCTLYAVHCLYFTFLIVFIARRYSSYYVIAKIYLHDSAPPSFASEWMRIESAGEKKMNHFLNTTNQHYKAALLVLCLITICNTNIDVIVPLEKGS